MSFNVPLKYSNKYSSNISNLIILECKCLLLLNKAEQALGIDIVKISKKYTGNDNIIF